MQYLCTLTIYQQKVDASGVFAISGWHHERVLIVALQQTAVS